jgi:hypothetical protein
MNYFIEL